jgi:hypothetical protein
LKIADRTEMTKSPIEPLAGFLMEGGGGFWVSEGRGFRADGATTDGIFPSKLIVLSSAIIASSKPAHPGWLSTTLVS